MRKNIQFELSINTLCLEALHFSTSKWQFKKKIKTWRRREDVPLGTKKQENKDLCTHLTWCKHLLYQELIISGKISIGVPVKGGLLQATFITVRFDYMAVWQAQASSTTLVLHRLLLPAGFRHLCSLQSPCCDQGRVHKALHKKLHKEHSLFTSNLPNRQSRQRQEEKYHDPYFVYKELSHREVRVCLELVCCAIGTTNMPFLFTCTR